MFYSSTNPGGVPTSANQEKSGNIYIPGQGPYAHVPPGYAPAQQVLPNGMTAAARYSHTPQAYAMVSTPGGHPAYAAGVYSSMPYPGLAGIPTSSHAYMSAAQYPGGMSYQAAALAGRSAGHHQHYTMPTPVQAGAPLFAAGYSPVPAGIATPGARSVQMGPVATAAAYPPGYGFPAASTDGTVESAYVNVNITEETTGEKTENVILHDA